MGFFGAYVFSGGGWADFDPDAGSPRTVGSPWISVEIHDSDFTAVRYQPAQPGTGVAYLGMTPRIYFDDPKASAPTDVEAEAAALAQWASRVVPDGEDPGRELAVRRLLAADQEPQDDDDVDDSEIFVEMKTVKFLRTMGLSLPDGLAEIEP